MTLLRRLTPILLLFPLQAEAGSLQVDDQAGLLKGDDVARLQKEASKVPFDIRILISNADSKVAFERAVELMLTRPDSLAIGIHPAQRQTAVYFGRDLGIPQSAFAAVRKAGNPHFKTGNYADGIISIQREAYSRSMWRRPEKVTSVPVSSPPPSPAPSLTTTQLVPAKPQKVEKNDFPWMVVGIVVLGVLAIVAIGTWLLYRQRKMLQAARSYEPVEDYETDDLPRSYREPSGTYVSPPPAQPATVIMPERSDVDTMMMGMMLGQAMNQPTSSTVIVVNQQDREPPTSPQHHVTLPPTPREDLEWVSSAASWDDTTTKSDRHPPADLSIGSWESDSTGSSSGADSGGWDDD